MSTDATHNMKKTIALLAACVVDLIFHAAYQ